jgi:membrane-associated phospholipid phosphatase
MAGMHYPSDVDAGQRLGKAYATWWISQPQNRQRILEACGAEWKKAAGVGP